MVIFENGHHIMDYLGEQLAEHEKGERYGMVQDPIALGVKIVIPMMNLTHHSLTVHSQVELQHLLTTNLNLKLMLDIRC